MTFLDDVLAAGMKQPIGCAITRLLNRLEEGDRADLRAALDHPAATHVAIAREIVKRGWMDDVNLDTATRRVGAHRRGTCC